MACMYTSVVVVIVADPTLIRCCAGVFRRLAGWYLQILHDGHRSVRSINLCDVDELHLCTDAELAGRRVFGTLIVDQSVHLFISKLNPDIIGACCGRCVVQVTMILMIIGNTQYVRKATKKFLQRIDLTPSRVNMGKPLVFSEDLYVYSLHQMCSGPVCDPQ